MKDEELIWVSDCMGRTFQISKKELDEGLTSTFLLNQGVTEELNERKTLKKENKDEEGRTSN